MCYKLLQALHFEKCYAGSHTKTTLHCDSAMRQQHCSELKDHTAMIKIRTNAVCVRVGSRLL